MSVNGCLVIGLAVGDHVFRRHVEPKSGNGIVAVKVDQHEAAVVVDAVSAPSRLASYQPDTTGCATKATQPHGKEGQRRKTADQAVADFEASKTLARAREAVRYVMEKWKRDDVSPEITKARTATLKP